MDDKELENVVEAANLIEQLGRECKGDGTGAIARLVRDHGWTFEMKLGDDGVFLGVIGKPLP